MLSGRRAFSGATAADTIVGHPDAGAAGAHGVGGATSRQPSIASAVKRCLERIPGEPFSVGQGRRVCAFRGDFAGRASGPQEIPTTSAASGVALLVAAVVVVLLGIAAAVLIKRRPAASVPTAASGPSIAVLPLWTSAGQGPGVLFRRPLGRAAEPAGEDPAAAVIGAHVVFLVQGEGDRGSGDRSGRCT